MVGDCDFAEHFSVERDVCFFEAADKPAVHNSALSAGGGNTGNPKRPEVAFSELSAETGVNTRADEGSFCRAIKMARRSSLAPDGFQDSLMSFAPCGAFSDSWHSVFPFQA